MSEVAVETAARGDAGTETRGVYQLLGGVYGASIWDFAASRAYGAAAAKLSRPRARKDAARPEPGVRTAFRACGVGVGSFGIVEDAARAYAAAAATKLPGARERSKFRGVTRTRSGKYGARITHQKGTVRTQVWLGSFESAEEAARAFDTAAVELRGERAITNFGPDTVMACTAQHGDLSTAEWQRAHELLKDIDSNHDKEALMEAAAILHQIALAGRHGDEANQHR